MRMLLETAANTATTNEMHKNALKCSSGKSISVTNGSSVKKRSEISETFDVLCRDKFITWVKKDFRF